MTAAPLLPVLVFGTIICGCLNSLFTKYQDNQCVKYCDDPDESKHQNFEQPALQTLQMFVGEMLCFIVYQLMYRSSIFQRGDRNKLIDGEGVEPLNLPLNKSLKLSIPAICDLTATTLLNVGLIYIPVSVYQMLRGAIVLSVALLSVIFLKKRITKLEWISLSIVTLGIALVGFSGSNSDSNKEGDKGALVVLGVFLVIIATLCQAVQFVVEEHILMKQPTVPLQLVYYEGFYGAIIIVIIMIVMNFIEGIRLPSNEFNELPFNLHEGFSQMFHSTPVLIGSILTMLSIACFNYFGISLTFYSSATARSTIDSCRTLLVWILAMVMGWESFSFLQFIGFSFLVFGTLCFNQVFTPELWNWVPSSLKTPIALQDHIEEPIDRL